MKSMIQDILPDEFHNEFLTDISRPDPQDTVFVFDGRDVLCRITEYGEDVPGGGAAKEVVFPSFAKLCCGPAQFTYLFSIIIRSEAEKGEYIKRYFLLKTEQLLTERFSNGEYSFASIRTLRGVSPKRECFAAETAYHLSLWYSNNRFCGRCAAEMVPSDKERAMVCPQCGNIVYPRISPAVIVGVTDGDRLLMSRYKGRPFTDYALIAGFCEIGETVEETVKREVMEETGLKVSNIRYYKSQPWGFDGGLLFGFYCDVEGPREIRVDQNELSEAAFFERDSISGQRIKDISLTSEMMLTFKEGKEPKV